MADSTALKTSTTTHEHRRSPPIRMKVPANQVIIIFPHFRNIFLLLCTSQQFQRQHTGDAVADRRAHRLATWRWLFVCRVDSRV